MFGVSSYTWNTLQWPGGVPQISAQTWASVTNFQHATAASTCNFSLGAIIYYLRQGLRDITKPFLVDSNLRNLAARSSTDFTTQVGLNFRTEVWKELSRKHLAQLFARWPLGHSEPCGDATGDDLWFSHCIYRCSFWGWLDFELPSLKLT